MSFHEIGLGLPPYNPDVAAQYNPDRVPGRYFVASAPAAPIPAGAAVFGQAPPEQPPPLVFRDGTMYYGPLKEGKPHGKGFMRMSPKDDYASYEGDFVNGLFHGEGVLTWKDETTYAGPFVLGKMKGENGVKRYPKGHQIVNIRGSWDNNLPHGQVTVTYTNGDTYIGEMERGKRSKGEYSYMLNGHNAKMKGIFQEDEIWDGTHWYFPSGGMGNITEVFRNGNRLGNGCVASCCPDSCCASCLGPGCTIL